MMENELTELEKSIYKDVQSEIWKYYDSVDIIYKEESFDKTIIDFLSYLYRLIPVIQREVHYSKELLNKRDLKEITEEQIEILNKYEDAFSKGKDMNIFLSNNIKEPRKPDFLLYTWHLYHLHMSGKFVEDVNQMKNNRSNTQLLCIINASDVYFVDIIPHPQKAEEYFNLQSLKIIKENGWMEKIGFFEIKNMIPKTLQPKITEMKDIFKLYACGFNLAFEFEGKAYQRLSQMSQARRPLDATRKLFEMKKKISELNDVEGTYKDFKLCSKDNVLQWFVELETPEGELKIFNIF